MPKTVSSVARPALPGDVVEHKSKRIEPGQGIVLALNDPAVWANSVAFPTPQPDAQAIKVHVARSTFTKVPVAWSRGTGRQVKWCSPSLLTVIQRSNQRTHPKTHKASHI